MIQRRMALVQEASCTVEDACTRIGESVFILERESAIKKKKKKNKTIFKLLKMKVNKFEQWQFLQQYMYIKIIIFKRISIPVVLSITF